MFRQFLDGIPSSPIDRNEIRRFQEEALREVVEGGDPVMAEMAREVQDGHLTLRDAANSLAYRDAFAKAAEEFAAALDGLSTEEIQQLAQDESADELIEKIVEERDQARKKPEAPDADDFHDGDDGDDDATVMKSFRQ